MKWIGQGVDEILSKNAAVASTILIRRWQRMTVTTRMNTVSREKDLWETVNSHVLNYLAPSTPSHLPSNEASSEAANQFRPERRMLQENT
jgi:hypothetical protein